MKKTLSLILAVAMVLSIFSSVSLTAFAATVKQVEYNLSEPITLIENIDGYWEEEGISDEYFYYFYYLNAEDTVKVTMSDGTEVVYTYSEEIDEFVTENGDILVFYLYDNQEEEHWGLGEHEFKFVVCDNYGALAAETDIPVTVIENPVVSAEFYFPSSDIDKFTVVENTHGYWCGDDEDDYFFNYDLAYLFEEGSKILLTMKDGSTVLYTYTLLEFPEEEWSYTAFVDDNGNELMVNQVEQYDNPWGVGQHKAEMIISNYGITFKIPVEIIKGTQDDCWHAYGEWEYVDGYVTKSCIGCENVVKLPFTDLRFCEYYGDFIEYTSVDNKFITGTNPPERTLFSPNTTITRAMFVTILYRMADEPYNNGNNPYGTKSPFTDIKDTSVYYYNAACWALDNDITNQLTFKPYDNVSREQTAAFLFRYAKANDMIYDEDYKDVDLSDYYDYKRVSDWAVEAMQWANYNGMITGTLQNFLNPKGSTLRIHATKILYGFGYTCGIGNFGW